MNEKHIKNFIKETISGINKSGKTELNYSNLISFILRISGLEFENSEEIELNKDNCIDFNILDEIILKSKLRNEIFNISKLNNIFGILCTEIYNK